MWNATSQPLRAVKAHWALVILMIVMLCRMSAAQIEDQQKPSKPADEQFKAALLNASIDIKQIRHRDFSEQRIPALTQPAFVSLKETEEDDGLLGVLIEMNGENRFYPYSILTWHELVNDSIGDRHFLVSYCPLTGSAIVFDRKVKDEALAFGVSDMLFESNVLMYDLKTKSLWSQAGLRCVAGDYNGTPLAVLPMQQVKLGEARKLHPDVKVLSRATGYERDYKLSPYGLYAINDQLFFPVSKKDTRFGLKEKMYAIPFKGASLAIPLAALKEGNQTQSIDGASVQAFKNGECLVVSVDGESAPGYYIMWFSWLALNGDKGRVWPVELTPPTRTSARDASYQGRNAAPLTPAPTTKKKTWVYPHGEESAPPTPGKK
ncbi:DUF3179 domain-containing protein [Candidatus Sumerlaeota bacterium]|nr:DUF3179 domain-containing protein [Candidatus Sumerlaeota bacterium]